MKLRLAGLILILLLTPVAIVSWFLTVFRTLVFADDRAREMLGGLDIFGNTGMFFGSRFETISSHAGREAANGKLWAKTLSAFLDLLEDGHCAGANLMEQPLLDVIAQHNGK